MAKKMAAFFPVFSRCQHQGQKEQTLGRVEQTKKQAQPPPLFRLRHQLLGFVSHARGFMVKILAAVRSVFPLCQPHNQWEYTLGRVEQTNGKAQPPLFRLRHHRLGFFFRTRGIVVRISAAFCSVFPRCQRQNQYEQALGRVGQTKKKLRSLLHFFVFVSPAWVSWPLAHAFD